MRPSIVLAVTLAEMRTTLRLVQYWLFALLSIGLGCFVYVELAVTHGNYSGIAAGLGTFSPQFYVALFGVYFYLWLFVGMIFLAFEIRARDERDQMVEVLDSRPYGNAEYVAGKFCALVVMAWLPIVLLMVLVEAAGHLALWFDFPYGVPPEPWSITGFLIYALAGLSMWCAFIMWMTTVCGNRLVVAAISLAVIGVQVWTSRSLPFYLTTVLSMSPGIDYASEISPRLLGSGEGIRLTAFAILAVAFLAFAARSYPRNDGRRPGAYTATGLVLAALGLAGMGGYYLHQTLPHRQQEAWLAAHEAMRHLPRADLLSITGTLSMEPGDDLRYSLALEVAREASAPLLFTLNPGVQVEQVSVDGKQAVWTHESGLLAITPTAAELRHSILMVAKGSPNESFGYLDASFDQTRARSLKSGEQSDLLVLGHRKSIFDSRYVAMMPGAHWIPSTGPAIGDGDPEDYYLLDLTVEVPGEWLVAGPGKAAKLGSAGGTASYRFHPGAPVPHVGLLASRFARKSIEANGIQLQLLYFDGHDRNLALFAETSDTVRDRLAEMFSNAQALGLRYPYDALSLVETPASLRLYAGGWRMDTAQAMPGVLILRENGFLTSRFEAALSGPPLVDPAGKAMAERKAEMLVMHFENDFSGGNPFSGAARNFLLFQTSAEGEGSIAVNFVLNALATKLLTGRESFFSAHDFRPGGVTTRGQMLEPVGFASVAEGYRTTVIGRPSVWSAAREAPLSRLDVETDPGLALKVLTLKGEALAEALLEGLGREKAAALLSQLLADHRGARYSYADLKKAAAETGTDLHALLGDWLHATALPGFIPSPVTSRRIADDAGGNPRYQTQVSIYNGETVSGLVQLQYVWGDATTPVNDQTEPFSIPGRGAVDVGIETSTPLRRLTLRPYLALNRVSADMALPLVEHEERHADPGWTGVRSSDWRPPPDDAIYVDDLDRGFSVRGQAGLESSTNPLLEDELDEGLPEFVTFLPPPVWSRTNSYHGWGKYRRTVALVASGPGDRAALFTATLPHGGRWRLAYHLWVVNPPEGMFQRFVPGKYDMTLVAGERRQAVEFDAAVSGNGWNELGEFDLEAGPVALEVSNSTTGNVVFADAIRWEPVGSGP
ncbi:MAG: hypothetical protein OXM59_10200 [Gammaproteobacteria bacterium]|nr:hypothetical protein [Gammaproteobacteria bacterium]